MSDSVSTNTLAFYRGKDRPCGVAVSPGGVTAGPAPENSFRQWESLLGSRETTRTRHRCVGGRHNHHRPARPRSGSDQFTFRRTDSVVGSFTRHRGLEQKLGTEILHSDQLVVADDGLRPGPRRVLSLAGNLFVQSRGLPLRGLIAPRTVPPRFRFTPGHAPLVGGQPIRCRLRVSRGFQIKLRLGSSGNAENTPVDTHRTGHLAQRGIVDTDHETGIPVAQRVLKHSNAGWFAGQFARPHHRDQPAASQTQATVFETEPVTGVLQTRQSGLRVLEVASALTSERAQRLLLRGHRAFPQPRQPSPRGSQVLARQVRAAIFARRNTLVPNPARPMPLAQHPPLRHGSGPKPVVVAKHRGRGHRTNIFDGSDISRRRHMHQATTNGHPYLPTAKARGISGGLG